jgi:putative resolvase
MWFTFPMKLSQYARTTGNELQHGASLVTSGRDPWLSGPSGTIIVEAEAKPHTREDRVAIYARVSSAEHRENLERQVERLVQYCTVRGYQVTQIVKEIASGVNDSRPKLLALLKDHPDRRRTHRPLDPLRLPLSGNAVRITRQNH